MLKRPRTIQGDVEVVQLLCELKAFSVCAPVSKGIGCLGFDYDYSLLLVMMGEGIGKS